ncbi:MAG: rhodanese-like domain-containing protein [Myxococcota bacterium]|nr:rhodanese-like domain-containing protein [Deltaproteobacteria bacterium]MDQ3341642.1 rhodanese-like domain-containing protein [Myxococcota bacterium]
MRTLLFTALLSLSVLGCSKEENKTQHVKLSATVPDVTIDELSAKLANGECQAVDANGDATRKKLGVIPGAVLLTDSETFSTNELPKDKSKTLVFYCANTHCSASEEAAARALTAGYKNVKILSEGIAGWVAAGKQTQKI